MDSSSGRNGLFHKPGSISVVAALRWLARGAAIASTSGSPRSRWPVRVWSTVAMMVAPPGDPSASSGRPSSSTIVGAIDERGRFPGPGRFGSWTAGLAGAKEKSVSSLLRMKPRPGTVMPLPPVDSMVRVYATTLPHLSAAVRCVVFSPSYVVGAAVPAAPHPLGLRGSPGASGLFSTASSLMRHSRESANRWDSRPFTGTSSKAGSRPTAPGPRTRSGSPR